MKSLPSPAPGVALTRPDSSGSGQAQEGLVPLTTQQMAALKSWVHLAVWNLAAEADFEFSVSMGQLAGRRARVEEGMNCVSSNWGASRGRRRPQLLCPSLNINISFHLGRVDPGSLPVRSAVLCPVLVAIPSMWSAYCLG